MFKLSPTYANRADLRGWEKYLFTIQERIESNLFARAMYRRYHFLPKWLKDTVEGVSILPAMVFLIPWLWVGDGITIHFGWEAENRMTPFLFASAPCIYGALAYLHPLGWVPIGSILLMVLVLKVDSIFHDYELELRRTS